MSKTTTFSYHDEIVMMDNLAVFSIAGWQYFAADSILINFFLCALDLSLGHLLNEVFMDFL